MVELDAEGNLPMVGPFFRLALRSSPSRAYANKAYFIGVIEASSPTDFASQVAREARNETYVDWLTDWMDISAEGWQKRAGLLECKPELGMSVEVVLGESAWPQRHRGSYLDVCEQTYNGFPFAIPRVSGSRGHVSHGTWFLPIADSVLAKSAKRYSDTLTKAECNGGSGSLGWTTRQEWYETSRPGGVETDVKVLQRRVAVLIEMLGDLDRLPALKAEERAEVAAEYLRIVGSKS